MNTPKKMTHRLLDSVWTCEFVENDGEATILEYGCDDPEGYEREREFGQVTLRETQGRIVTALVVCDKYRPFHRANANDPDARILRVTNPQFIFSYDHLRRV